jgi:hypothetical protein
MSIYYLNASFFVHGWVEPTAIALQLVNIIKKYIQSWIITSTGHFMKEILKSTLKIFCYSTVPLRDEGDNANV